MKEMYDIAVVGSGFAGSIIAMIANRLGRSVILLEKDQHPRVIIGESSTPLSNVLLEELAARYNLPALMPLANWGEWQGAYPRLACGLKRGFTFYHHNLDDPERTASLRERLLVEASPNDRVADTHWYRADVDAFLVEQASLLGVDYLDRLKLSAFFDMGDHVALEGERGCDAISLRAQFVVDATGPRGFLHQMLALTERPVADFPKTETLYSHFSGVRRLDAMFTDQHSTLHPYPVDDAAVHHVFDGGWVWVLQFNNGITSAGVAATAVTAARLGLSDGSEAWLRLLAQIPVLNEQFAAAKLERQFTYRSSIPFRSERATGRNWAMLPSAFGFNDPLLSTGFPLTLLGVTRLAENIEKNWGTHQFRAELEEYDKVTQLEHDAAAQLIAALYANAASFPAFRAITLLYFASASFSETARRLGKPHLASSFLMHDRLGFGLECADLLSRATSQTCKIASRELSERIRKLIEPIDIAGLSDPSETFVYSVQANALLNSAWKLGATRQEVVQMLALTGFSKQNGTDITETQRLTKAKA